MDLSHTGDFSTELASPLPTAVERESCVLALRRNTLWTLAEVVFWIALRDLDAIAGHFTQDVIPWRTCGLGALYRMFDNDDIGKHGFADYLKKLTTELRLGSVLASGRYEDRGKRAPVPAEQWYDIELKATGGEYICRIVACPKAYGEGFAVVRDCWADVLFDRESVMQTFPAPAVDLSSISPIHDQKPFGEKPGACSATASVLGPTYRPPRATDALFQNAFVPTTLRSLVLIDEAVSCESTVSHRPRGHIPLFLAAAAQVGWEIDGSIMVPPPGVSDEIGLGMIVEQVKKAIGRQNFSSTVKTYRRACGKR